MQNKATREAKYSNGKPDKISRLMGAVLICGSVIASNSSYRREAYSNRKFSYRVIDRAAAERCLARSLVQVAR